MKETWNKAISFVLKWEGGYVNDPDDKGGETKYGIDKRSHPDVEVANLTMEDAVAIYKEEYWNLCKCDDIEFPMDWIVFDTAVNMGMKFAKQLQELEWKEALLLRIERYSHLNPKYLRGWVNRVVDLFKEIRVYE